MAVTYVSHTEYVTGTSGSNSLTLNNMPALGPNQSYLIIVTSYNSSSTNNYTITAGPVLLGSGGGSSGTGINVRWAQWWLGETANNLVITKGGSSSSMMAIVYVLEGIGDNGLAVHRDAPSSGLLEAADPAPDISNTYSEEDGGLAIVLLGCSRSFTLTASNSGWTNRADGVRTGGAGPINYISSTCNTALGKFAYPPAWTFSKGSNETGYGATMVILWPGGLAIASRDGVISADISTIDGVTQIASVDGVPA